MSNKGYCFVTSDIRKCNKRNISLSIKFNSYNNGLPIKYILNHNLVEVMR